MISNALSSKSYSYITPENAKQELTATSIKLRAKIQEGAKSGVITKEESTFMLESIAKGIRSNQDRALAGKLVTQVKTHKKVSPGNAIPAKIRVIISGVKSCSKNAQAWVGDQLQPILAATPSYVQDTAHAISKIQASKHLRRPILFVGDVEDMYPQAPRQKCRAVARLALQKHGSTAKATFTAEIEEIVSDSIIFTTDVAGEHVKMANGYGIGVGHSGQICGLEIASIEREAAQRANALSIQAPKLMIRLQDDIFGTFEGTEDELDEYLRIIDKIIAPRIITWEKSKRHAIWCDLKISIGVNFLSTGFLETALYQKPTDQGLYLPRSSHHPEHTFKGIMKGEAIRLLVNCSTQGAYDRALVSKRQQFERQGYDPKEITEALTGALKFRERTSILQHRATRRSATQAPKLKKTRVAMSLPFTGRTKQLKIGLMLSMLNREISKHKVKVAIAHCATRTLGQKLRKW